MQINFLTHLCLYPPFVLLLWRLISIAEQISFSLMLPQTFTRESRRAVSPGRHSACCVWLWWVGKVWEEVSEEQKATVLWGFLRSFSGEKSLSSLFAGTKSPLQPTLLSWDVPRSGLLGQLGCPGCMTVCNVTALQGILCLQELQEKEEEGMLSQEQGPPPVRESPGCRTDTWRQFSYGSKRNISTQRRSNYFSLSAEMP